MCHVNAWEFFGGAAVRTVRDNLKTGVKKHPREGEVELNCVLSIAGFGIPHQFFSPVTT